MAVADGNMRGALVALVALIATVFSASAQIVNRGPTTHDPVTAQDIERRLETRAAEIQKVAPQGAARMVLFDVAWPATPDEARALGFNAVVFLSALSKQADELPLAKVYASILKKPVELRRISGQRRTVSADSIVARMFGPHRDDAFYVLPAASWHDGLIGADFAKNRKDFSINKTPLDPPDFIRNGHEASGVPVKEALNALIQREYPGL
jgi:hypothetical protein